MDRLLELEVYVRVVHAGSFTAAGRDLGLTPSAVSKQIGRLEDRLGVRLLNRTTRKVAMTEEGVAFFEHAKRIIADLDEAEQALSKLSAAPRGLLRVNMPVTFGQLILAPLVPEFLRRYPDVEVDITLNDRLVDLVEDGMDLGIRIGALKDSSLIARKLASSRRAVCAGRSGRPQLSGLHLSDLAQRLALPGCGGQRDGSRHRQLRRQQRRGLAPGGPGRQRDHHAADLAGP